MFIPPQTKRAARRFGHTAKLAICIGAAFGACLGADFSAVANSAATRPRDALTVSLELTPPQTYALARFSSQAPQLLQVSIQPGQVTPPWPNRPVLHLFDAVAECADADVEIERRMAALDKLTEQPRLDRLEQFWESHGLVAKSIALGAPVPPLFLDKLPPGFAQDLDVDRKKQSFFLPLLPHVLKVNAEILADRSRLLSLRSQLSDPTGPSPREMDWLFGMFETYGVETHDIDELLAKVDAIPPALALAQAAKESGWGASRFAQAGNALYGQWTWNPDDKGIVPRQRPPGKTYRVRAFDNLLDATRAYALNINRHPAYNRLRTIRYDLRRKGRAPSGFELTSTLDKYSAIGQRYVRALRNIIERNGLAKLNKAHLAPTLAPPSQIAIQPMVDKFSDDNG